MHQKRRNRIGKKRKNKTEMKLIETKHEKTKGTSKEKMKWKRRAGRRKDVKWKKKGRKEKRGITRNEIKQNKTGRMKGPKQGKRKNEAEKAEQKSLPKKIRIGNREIKIKTK